MHDWVRPYLVVPWLEDGRTREGADCWGLVRLVLAEQAGIDLPELPGAAAARLTAARDEALSGRWHEIDRGACLLQRFDVPLYVCLGTLHCGIMLDSRWMLSTYNQTQGVRVEEFDSKRPAWRRIALQVYRHHSLMGQAPIDVTQGWLEVPVL